MLAIRVSLFFFLCCAVSDIKGQDFDLFDAVPDASPTPPPKKPAPPTKKPASDNDFDLYDAVGGGGDDKPQKPPVKPQPGGSDKGIDDSDLYDAVPEKKKGGVDGPESENKVNENEDFDIVHLLICIWNMAGLQDFEAQSPGAIAGIVSAVAMALFGMASSYFAYQKKKLCFKEDAGQQENVLMENQNKPRSGQNVQSGLISK